MSSRACGWPPVTVRYATGDGTATAGDVYVATRGLVTCPAGKRSRTVQVSLTPDTLPEGDETFRLRLSAPRRAQLADIEALATIVDDDPPAVVPVAPRDRVGRGRPVVLPADRSAVAADRLG
ncbi:MAG: hypothetical protein FJ284_07090 [Planctomycetes bacterium]|nr:hypothetical protein [Planctomycetota bacterium]